MARPTLVALILASCLLTGRSSPAQTPARPEAQAQGVTIPEAVRRGVALMRKAATNYPNNRDCFACHHQTLPMLAMVAAQRAGLGSNGDVLKEQAEFSLESFKSRIEPMREGKGIGGGAMTVSYGLWALELAGHAPDDTTDAMVSFLLKTQQADGRWLSGSNRPPLEESSITATVLSAAGLRRYARGDAREKAEAAIARAKTWIAKAPVRVQEDRTSKLWGLYQFGSDIEARAETHKAVLATQKDNGGWPSRDDLPPDAYATGQTLVRLLESGMDPRSPQIRKGIDYLRRTRLDDGSWKVETRSKPIQVMFDNGDPHGKHQFISTPATAWAITALASVIAGDLAPAKPYETEDYDLVIRGGRVVDGSGNPWFLGDVAIRGDRIAAVGHIPADAPTKRTLDAKGKVVAPGFIDMHSHSDMPLLEDGAALSKVYQGVTTEVLGEDDSGGPSKGKRKPATFTLSNGSTKTWTTLEGYLDTVESSGTAVNVASYVGLGTLLDCVLGDSLERPTPAQLDEVKTLLAEALNDGAFGLSTMVAGARELKVTTEDLVELARVVAKHGGIYSSHIRNEGTEVLQAIDEAIRVGEEGGVPVDIIHIKIAEQKLWGRMDEIIARIEKARARGVNVQSNVYPYTRGNNDLVTIVPPWAHEGGTQALLARLRDPAQRARIKADIVSGLPGWYDHYTAVGGDWSRMLVSARLSDKNKAFQGKTMDVILAEMARRDGKGSADPLDLMLDFLFDEGGSVGTIYAHHTEADMNRALAQPWCSIGSDGSALAIEGRLRRGHPHPRSFGTFPRVLGVYVRERHLLTLEDAIRKMTSLNAAKLGLRDRGLIRHGLAADITVFDPETILDRSTYLEPFQYSAGITHVLVNGALVMEAGKPTAARPGKALRRGR